MLYNSLHCPVVPGRVQDFNRFNSVNWLYRHWNSHKIDMGFFGGYFLVQGFFWVLLEALGIFLGLDF